MPVEPDRVTAFGDVRDASRRDVEGVADAIVKVVDAPFGKRPFRVHYDPTQDGAEVVNMVSDRVRAELLRRIGLGDLLTPRDVAVELQSAT